MSLRELHKYNIFGGDFAETPIASLMGLARYLHATGTLEVEREKVKKTVYFMNGVPVYCESDLPGETLRQVLFKAGTINRSKLDEVEKTMKMEQEDEDKAMLRLGILDESTRYSQLSTLARKRILACFQWNTGKYRFCTGEAFLEAIDLFDIDPLDLIHEGISTYQATNVAQEIQDASNMEVQAVGDLSELEPFLERYHPQADLGPIKNGAIKVFQALPSLNKDINYALTLVYELIITGYLSLDGHRPGDCAPPLDPGMETACEEFGAEEEKFDSEPELATGATTYRRSTPMFETIIPQAKPKTMPHERPVPPVPAKPAPKAPVPPPRFQKKMLKAYDGSATPRRGIQSNAPTSQPAAPSRQIDSDLMNRFQKMRDLIKSGDYFDLLGVMIETDRADIKKQYFQRNQQFHADRARPLGPEGEALSQEITGALNHAYQTLLEPGKRYEYEMGLYKKEHEMAWSMPLQQELAKKQFRRGRWHLAQKRPDLAFTFFNSAVNLDTDQASYYAFLGWAQYAADKSKVGEARAFLKTAIGINSKHPEAMLFLGWILKETGHEDEAAECFDRSLKADPNNKWAKAELDKLPAPKQKSDGILSRFFKK